ncbi:MAG: hypothetical protein VW455_08495 [Nitrospinota bacterium]
MSQNLLNHILFEVFSENKRSYSLKMAIFILFIAVLILPLDVLGVETDFKTYRKAAQEKISQQLALIEQDPMDFQSYFELGMAYLKLGRHREEVQAYKEALWLNPKSALTHYNLSIAYDHLKVGDKAIHHMQVAQDLYATKRNHRKIRTTQRLLKRYYMSYPKYSGKNF